MSKAKRRAGRPALEMIETTLHLLRSAPAGVLLSYYAGSIPCLLGLLYFWADMSRGAFARDRLIEAAFGAALGYLWMKCWHAIFAAKMRAHLLLEHEPPWTVGRVVRLVLLQTAVQPIGLFVRLLAAQIIIPYVWTYGFFQNVGVLGDGTRPGFGEVIREAARQAGLWQRQAHYALAVIFGFTFFIWIDIAILVWFVPSMLKTFFGIETVFSRDGWLMANSTTFAATLAGTYLCMDPIRKTLYVLRCFHGSSLETGEDLRVELQAQRVAGRMAAVAVLIFGLFLAGPLATARAAEPPPPRVESAELSGAVDRVLQKREYAWRLPRTAGEAEKKGWFTQFFEGLWKKLTKTVKTIWKWLGDTWDRLRKTFDREPKPRDLSERGGSFNWTGTARWTLIILIGALLIVVGLLFWKWRQGRQAEIAVAEPLAAVPDLTQENVTADQLPEDGWLQLARELMDRGELRLALRALYLAGLAHLGRRELIAIARHKSNRDYDRELRRRARGNADLLSAFDANLLTFEASWYGEHLVTSETLGGFSQNLERIRTC